MSVGIWKQQTQEVQKITEGGNIISLTRTEYEELETKNPNILYVITDDEQGAQEGVYSQSETICGTWIDGKPIYRRVFILQGDLYVPINNYTSTGITISNVSKYIRREVISAISNFFYWQGETTNITSAIDANTLQQGTEIVVEYTKTTD